jgi:hypothetical protein
MPPTTDAYDSSSSCVLLSVDDDGCLDIEELYEEDEENDDAGS